MPATSSWGNFTVGNPASNTPGGGSNGSWGNFTVGDPQASSKPQIIQPQQPAQQPQPSSNPIGNFFSGVEKSVSNIASSIAGWFTTPGGQPTPINHPVIPQNQVNQIQVPPNVKVGDVLPGYNNAGNSAQLAKPATGLAAKAGNAIDNTLNDIFVNPQNIPDTLPGVRSLKTQTGNPIIDNITGFMQGMIDSIVSTPKQALVGVADLNTAQTWQAKLSDTAKIAMLPLTIATFGEGGGAVAGGRTFLQVVKDAIPVGLKYGFGFGTLNGLIQNVNAPTVQAQIGLSIIQGLVTAPIGVLTAVGLGVGSKALSDYVIGPTAKVIVDKFGYDAYNFLANKELIQRVVTGKGSAEDLKQFNILNKAGITAEVARSGEASVSTESQKQGKMWDILRSLYPDAVKTGDINNPETTPLKQLSGNSIDTQKLGADYVGVVKSAGDAPTIFHLSPQQAASMVIGTNLENGATGRGILKTTMQAQQQGKDIQISVLPKGSNLPAVNMNFVTPDGHIITNIGIVDRQLRPQSQIEAPKPVQPTDVVQGQGFEMTNQLSSGKLELAKQFANYTKSMTDYSKDPSPVKFEKIKQLKATITTLQQTELQSIKIMDTPEDKILNPIVNDIIKSNGDQNNKTTLPKNSNSKTLQESVTKSNTNQGIQATNGATSQGVPNRVTSGASQSQQNNPTNERPAGSVNEGAKSTTAETGQPKGTGSTGTGESVKSDNTAGNGTGLKSVGGSGEQVVSKHAAYIEAQAILRKITDKPFETLSTHEKAVWSQQKEMAQQLHKDNPELAMKVALGEANAPEGMLPAPIHNYVVSQTTDLATMLKLGSSPYNDQLTAVAQQLGSAKLFKEADNPTQRTVDAIKEVNQSIDNANKDKIEKQTVEAKKTAKEDSNKTNLNKEDLSWDKFLDSIKC